MYDRPTTSELLDAVRMYLENEALPVVREDGRLYFQTLVAINVLKVVEREIEHSADHIKAEWKRLNDLEGDERPLRGNPAQVHAALAERNRQLAAAVRAGSYDDGERRAALFQHLLATTREQLAVANPDFLREVADGAPDAGDYS